MPKSTVFFWEVGFLTFGKVNGAKIDRFFWGGGGGFLTFGKVNGAKIDRFLGGGGFLTLRKVNGAKIDRFLGEEGVLDIKEGQRCQIRPFFLGEKKQKKAQRKIGAKIDRFSRGRGRGVQI